MMDKEDAIPENDDTCPECDGLGTCNYIISGEQDCRTCKGTGRKPEGYVEGLDGP